MARGSNSQGRRTDWRALVARAILLVFLAQCFGLFATSPRNAAEGSASSLISATDAEGMVAEGMVDCPHHRAGGKARDSGKAPGSSHESGGCPMCQMLGCALAGAPAAGLVVRSNERLIGLLSAPAPAMPPRAPPREDSRPRGPPVLV